MITILENNEEIYSLLEHTENLFTDFSLDKVLAFENEDDFCVVLYASSNRNFRAFIAAAYLQQTEALPVLLETIQEYPQENVSAALLEEAAKMVEDKMHSQNNSRFYFDAH